MSLHLTALATRFGRSRLSSSRSTSHLSRLKQAYQNHKARTAMRRHNSGYYPTHHHAGMSPVVTIFLIILVVGVIAGLAYYFISKNKKNAMN